MRRLQSAVGQRGWATGFGAARILGTFRWPQPQSSARTRTCDRVPAPVARARGGVWHASDPSADPAPGAQGVDGLSSSAGGERCRFVAIV